MAQAIFRKGSTTRCAKAYGCGNITQGKNYKVESDSTETWVYIRNDDGRVITELGQEL